MQTNARRRFGFALAAATLLFTHGIASAQTAPDPTASYTFTLDHPPLLKDFHGGVLSLPNSTISRVVGSATWVVTQGKIGDLHVNSWTYTLTRTQRWAIWIPPEHFAVDTNRQVTQVQGYSLTQSTSFSNTLDISGGVSLFGWLKADVKDSLNITEGTTEQWKTETSVQVNKNYKAGNTYITWYLIDSLHLDKVTTISGTCCNTTYTPSSSDLDVMVTMWEDAVDDNSPPPPTAASTLKAIFNGETTKTINALAVR